MTACNARPPKGHPLHGTGVACHLADDHLVFGEAHSWDIDAALARHIVIRTAIDKLRVMFPDDRIEQFDAQLPHPLAVYDVGWACEECDFWTDDEAAAFAHCDAHRHSLARSRRADPYRQWETPAGPWLVLRFERGGEYAIWKTTGDVYRVGVDGAVDEDPIIRGSDLDG